MKVTILIGGKAGQGPNILTHTLAESLVDAGYYAFYSRDYQSLIKGGHNFNVLTFSDEPVHSNESLVDVLVALDDNTVEVHKGSLKKGGIVLRKGDENMYYAGYLFKLLGIDFGLLEKHLKEISNFDENMKFAKEGYGEGEDKFSLATKSRGDIRILNGSEGVANGAVLAGLEYYYAYPMTPATPVLTELAKSSLEGNHLTIELENEISVVNAAVGSAIVGSKVMVGTSGGGFDLMTEGLSLTGIAEVPVVFYLAMRPGPGTGVATYTSQGDLKMALNAGHGEFSRVVVAGGDPLECESLISQCFYFSHKFRSPSIFVNDKHLGESLYSISGKPKIEKPSSIKVGRFNSYEKDDEGSATEDPVLIKKNIDERLKKEKELEKEVRKFETYRVYGNKDSQNVVVSWGSTKGAILDAIKGLDVKFVQVLYLKPFADIRKEIEGKNLILVENSVTGALADVVAEETGIFIKDKILRYDGRPFLCDELEKEIKRRLK